MTSPKPLKKRLYAWLVHRTDNYQQNLRWVLWGFGTTLLGGLILLVANYFFAASVLQETLAALALLLLASGMLLAFAGFLSLSVLRLIRFMIEPPHKR